MSENSKQVVHFNVMKGFTTAQSNEHQRNWTERAWQNAMLHGNYDRSRVRLNFEITKGGKIRPIDTSVSIPKRMAEIENWAKDMYTFMCDKYGEENIIGFYVHCDETPPHLHCTLMPIKNGKFAFKELFAGKDKYEFSMNTKRLHNELAKVNALYGLVVRLFLRLAHAIAQQRNIADIWTLGVLQSRRR